jgi:diguanylate cyclase (GGDEF)-like protein
VKQRRNRPLIGRASPAFLLRAWRRQAQVWLLVALLFAGVALLWVTTIGRLAALPTPIHLPLPLLAVLFFIAERFVIDLEVREQTHSFSLSEIALVLGLIFASPFDVLAGQALGAGTALLLRPGQGLVKLAFNLGNFALATSVALVVFRTVLDGAIPLSPPGWLAAFAAALSSDLVGAGAVAAVIWLSQRQRAQIRSLFGFGTVYMLVATSLALVAATVLWHAPEASWLLVVLVLLAYIAIAIHVGELRRQRTLLGMHESTRRIQESFGFDEMSRSLLATARQIFEGELAEMLIFPSQGPEGRLLRLTDENPRPEWVSYQLDPREGVWARVSAEGRGLVMRPQRGVARHGGLLLLIDWLGQLLPSRIVSPQRVLAHFESRGIHSAMIAPLRVEDTSVGTLLVGNRRGSVNYWSEDDLTLLETLANHASVALNNSRQAGELARQRDELEWSAGHDSLTGLPNRVLFRRHLAEALTARRGAGVAVLVMDLDRFKEVNDTLGHHNGDQLLRDVAARLAAGVTGSATVARLGGDEFAVLLHGVDVSGAVTTAEEVLAVLRTPFEVSGVTMQVETSVGICVASAQGDDADMMLRRADVAMYRAKAGHTRYAIYEAQHDPYSEARLALLGKLRRALDEGELSIAYQPQATPSGVVEAFEALLRWHHPQLGDVPPDEFIGLAERSEIIHAVTGFVLGEAIGQCAAWRRAGHQVRVSINLSARDLLDSSLADDIAARLAAAGLPASALVLEITETAIESDPLRSEALLMRLHNIGVGIAIDDFGTGYSAYSYLARLPVEEIKIDRSFVMGMPVDERRLAIVRSTIQLGRNLGLRVVAEGVETETVRRQLVALDCNLLQGYHIGYPMSADLAGARLRQQPRPMRRRSRSPRAAPELPRAV